MTRWERAVKEWDRISRRIAAKVGKVCADNRCCNCTHCVQLLKDVDQSLLHRSDDYRQVMEERELIEKALGMQDDELHTLWHAARPLRTPSTGLFSDKRTLSRDPYVYSDVRVVDFFFVCCEIESTCTILMLL